MGLKPQPSYGKLKKGDRVRSKSGRAGTWKGILAGSFGWVLFDGDQTPVQMSVWDLVREDGSDWMEGGEG